MGAEMAAAAKKVNETRSDVSVYKCAVEAGRVDFAELQEVGSAMTVQYATNVGALLTPKLHTINEYLTISANLGLRKLLFPELRTCSGAMTIKNNYDLVSAAAVRASCVLENTSS